MATQSTTPTDGLNSAEVLKLKEGKLKSEGLTRKALRRLRKDYLSLAAISVLLALSILAAMAPTITKTLGISYTEPLSARRFLPINGVYCKVDSNEDGVNDSNCTRHYLGTDHLGRDTLARMLYGGRVSLSIGVVAALASTFIGVTLGLIAGYYQGGPAALIDDGIMWFITTLNSIPLLLLLIMLASVLTPSVGTLIMVMALVFWTGTMRLIRGETIAHRSNDYVLSARAMGAGPLRIMFIHILPNTLSVLVTATAIQIGTLILVESALSFLGFGVRPPEPSWGNMLTGAQAWFRQGPQLSIIPGMMIVITVLSLYLLGDGLRDAFDPRSTK